MAVSSSELGLNIGLQDQASKTAEQINKNLNRMIDNVDKINNRLRLMQQSLQAVKEVQLALNKAQEVLVKPLKPTAGATTAEINTYKAALEDYRTKFKEIQQAKQAAFSAKQETQVAISGTKIQKQFLDEQIKGYKNLQQINDQFVQNSIVNQKDYLKATIKGLGEESKYREERYKERLSKEQNYQNLVGQLRQKEIDSQKQFASILERNELQRQRLLTHTYALQRKSIADPATQQKFLDLATKLSKPLQTQTDIDNFKKTRQELALATHELTKQQAQVGILGRQWEKFRTVFARVFDALLSFLIIDWTRRIFFGFFQGLITSNQLLEQTQARLKSLIPDVGQLTEVWDKLVEVTITTPFKIQDIADATVQLKAFGVNIKDNIGVVADWATAIGRDISDVATAFGKIVQFSPRTALLLSTRGFSTAAFETYVARFGDRAKALAKLIEDTFGGTARRVSLTFTGLLSNISDVWTFISQTLGQPIFESFKSDLQFIFSLLQRFRKDEKETLSIIGEFINIGARGIIFAGITFGIAIVLSQLVKLKAAIITSKGLLTQFGKFTVVGLISSAIGLVIYQFVKLQDSIQNVIDAREKLGKLSGDDFNGQIEQLEIINKELEEQNQWYNLLISSVTTLFNYGFLVARVEKQKREAEIEDNKKKIEQNEKMLQQKQREILALNAVKDAVRDFELSRDIKELGLKDVLNEIVVSLRKYKVEGTSAEDIKFAKRFGLEDMFLTEETAKNINTLNEETAKWIESLLKGVTIEEAIAKTQKQIAEIGKLWVKSIIEGNPNQELFTRARALTEIVKELKELVSQTDKSNNSTLAYIESLKKVQSELTGEKAKFDELSKQDSLRERPAKIAELEAQLEENKEISKLGFESYMKTIGLSEKQLEIKIKEIESQKKITEEQKIYLDLLQEQLRFSKMINELFGLRQAEQSELNQLLQQQVDKMYQLQNVQRDFKRNKIQFQFDFGGITLEKYIHLLYEELSTVNLEYDKSIDDLVAKEGELVNLIGVERVKTENEIIDLQIKQYQILSDQQRIIQEIIAAPSVTWGNAWYKQLLKLQKATQDWRDQIVETISLASIGFIEESIKGFLSGPSDQDLDRISELQSQLDEVRRKKYEIRDAQTEITRIEDDELRIQLEIQKIERERSDFLKNNLLKAIETIQAKFVELASQKLFEGILEFTGADSDLINDLLGKKKDKEKDILSIQRNQLNELELVNKKLIDINNSIKSLSTEQPTGTGFDLLDFGMKLLSAFDKQFGGHLDYIRDSIPTDIDSFDSSRFTSTVPRNIDMSEMTRPVVSNNSSSTKVVQYNFNGDIYGYDDFKGKVKQVNKELSRSVI